VTLEYAIDDFSIAQVARAEHDQSLAATMGRRAANWEYEFNPATGYIQARGDDGSFPPGAAFEASQLEAGGQLGFEEGNAVQYTWSVPQDLAGLASLMGGDAAATGKLEAFMSSLNASRDTPQEWSGNEPSEWAPWEFDSFGAPEQTQRYVRAIADSQYADAPVDEPGNDDLGALASWYVWAALGLFPVTPGQANLALASPLFPSVAITLPDGRHLVETAPGASASRPYVHALTVSGLTPPAAGGPACAGVRESSAHAGTWDSPWLPASVLTAGAILRYTLSSTPDPTWGSSPDPGPPSAGSDQLPAVGFSRPSGATTVTAGQPQRVTIGVASAGDQATTVHWQAVPAAGGLTVTPSSGTLTLTPLHCTSTAPATQSLSITAPSPGSDSLRLDLSTSGGLTLPPVVVDVQAEP
jgi:putative alpha-1,2-mannosidase